MAQIRLHNFLMTQNALIYFPRECKNEFESIKFLHNLPDKRQREFNKLTLQFLEDCKQPHEVENYAQRSRQLREQGNQIFNTKTTNPKANQSERLLGACKLYTKAIMEAENAFEELCLGYANRGMALLEYGYYQQAYDDCASAMEFGYPKKNQGKLIMRQAICASKMGDFKKLAEHMSCLDKMELNENFSQQLEQLKQQLPSQQSKPTLNEAQTANDAIAKRHKVVQEAGIKGRYLVATEEIKKGELVIKEQASCFSPTSMTPICQQCASSLMCAPIPCPECHQRVVYCSRRCRQLHATIHSYECGLYSRDLMDSCIINLSLRSVLVHMPEWLRHLSTLPNANAQQLWQSLMELAAGKHSRDDDDDPQHMGLAMIKHLKKSEEERIFALRANCLQVYLFKYTNFYEQLLSSTAASKEHWHVVLAALIFRCVAQLRKNFVFYTCVHSIVEGKELALLQPGFWHQPYHLKRGCLHLFSDVDFNISSYVPQLGLCNHSCEGSMHIKIDGGVANCFAMHNIKVNEELTYCYGDKANCLPWYSRQERLKEVYGFNCRCKRCMQAQPDEEYFSFHRYRCLNTRCQRIYVPDPFQHIKHLSWWDQPVPVVIYCTVCRQPQPMDRYVQFSLPGMYLPEKRRKLYEAFNELDNWLLDYHSLKQCLARKLILYCFILQQAGCPLNKEDYIQLTRIIKFLMKGTEVQMGINSVQYITNMVFLWDFIALGKYKCSKQDMQPMLATLKYLSSEQQKIFMNYYNDFIEQQLLQ